MSKLTIEERVDRLLKEGVDNPKKWMPIHGFKERQPPKQWTHPEGAEWFKEYEKLREHHLEETNVLFDIIRELAKRVKP